eukprot:2383014-Pyramimonas_sp.AAC.1
MNIKLFRDAPRHILRRRNPSRAAIVINGPLPPRPFHRRDPIPARLRQSIPGLRPPNRSLLFDNGQALCQNVPVAFHGRILQ